MTPDSIKASYRRALGEFEPIVIRRYTGAGANRPYFDAPVLARVTGYEPNELVGTIQQGDRKLIVLADDLIAAQVPLDLRKGEDLFALIHGTPNLVWLLLTKRPQNIVKMVERDGCIDAAGQYYLPRNAAIGTTVEDQERAINLFRLAIAARETKPLFTFASFEPLLGPVDPTRVIVHEGPAEFYDNPEIKNVVMTFNSLAGAPSISLPPLGWAITGGETDQGGHVGGGTCGGAVMAIRLRDVGGIRVALCAAETDAMPGDVYLDDADHYALSAKFASDWQGQLVDWKYPAEWAAMATQKLRDAETELIRWLVEQAA